MRRLVLLRHGLTPWNAERRFQGHSDIELAPEGHRQARAAATSMASYSPSVLWSSDLARTVQTSEYVAEATQLVPVLDERLREIHVGSFAGLSYTDALARFGPEPWEYADHGGEAQAAAGLRVAAALGDLAAGLGPDETAVVVSHGAAIRLGTTAFLGWPATIPSTLAGLSNCGWVELVDLPGTLVGTQAPGWRLAAYNRVAS